MKRVDTIARVRVAFHGKGWSVKKIVRTLRPLRDVTISINGNEIVAKTPPGDTAQAILDAVAASVTH